MAKPNDLSSKYVSESVKPYKIYDEIIKAADVIRGHVKLFIVNVCSLLSISGIRECLVLLCNRTWEARGFVSS